VPVSTCRALGADVVIAVNLNSDIVGKRSSRKAKAQDQDDAYGEASGGMLQNLKQAAREYSNSIFAHHDKPEEPPRSFFAITNSINIVQDRITRSRLAGEPPEIVINPRLAHIGMLEFHRAPEAIAEGEGCVHKSLDEIRRLIANQR
jgi:NTE family protein